jgi:HD-GYP domain-containing protein (c-di-GMP phosphodiesterase class II)
MTSARAYRAARPAAAAFAELERFSGTQFDAASVDALVEAVPSTPELVERAVAQLVGRQPV